jgi:peptide/nickel transport system permease protein
MHAEQEVRKLTTEDGRRQRELEYAYSNRRRWLIALRQFARHRAAVVGLALGALVVLSAILAPVISPFNPLKLDISSKLQNPSAEHLLGTDELGRDVLSRILYGARVSIWVGMISVAIAFVLGTPLGLIGGYYGGAIDALIARFLDALLAFPAILLALAIVSALGPSLTNAMLAIGIVFVPQFARVMRAGVLAVKNVEYVQAARAVGASDLYILVRTIFPNGLSPLLVLASVVFADAVVTEAALSFLGLGIQPPTSSWGAMLSNGRLYLQQTPVYAFAAGMALTLTVLSLSLLGDEMRDILDPRLRTTQGA